MLSVPTGNVTSIVVKPSAPTLANGATPSTTVPRTTGLLVLASVGVDVPPTGTVLVVKLPGPTATVTSPLANAPLIR